MVFWGIFVPRRSRLVSGNISMASCKVLDGKWLSTFVLSRVAREVAAMQHAHGMVPGLGVILVGDNPASKTYVANKEKSAKGCGFQTFEIRLPNTATAADVMEAVQSFNANPLVHGILLQLPLPKGLESGPLLDAINPQKDADGLHPVNQGLLMRGEGVLRPCTPVGAMRLIDLAFSSIDPATTDATTAPEIPAADLSGKRAIIIGRSILVGKPAGLLLLEQNATVTMAHSKTPELAQRCSEADIVVAAVGVPRMVKADWIKPGAVVIDVGINRLPDGKLCGDVEYAGASERASAITPVPGGAGPMTVAMLIQNTLNSCKRGLAIR